MRFETDKTVVSLTFPFAATVMLMLHLCDADTVLVCLLSSLFHEGGHLLVMMLMSEFPESVVFGAFGIRIERKSQSFSSYGKEALIALGGVMGNALLITCGCTFYLTGKSQWSLRLVAVNLFIALFNLLPVKQLDAGRCLECIAALCTDEERGEKTLNAVSAVTLGLLVVGCVIYNIFISVNISFIAVTIYLVLISTLKEFKNDK